MRYISVLTLTLFIFCSISLNAQALQRDEDRFFYGSETDEDMQVIIPGKSYATEGIQYGAIIGPVFLYENKNGENLTTAIVNTRLWAKAYLWNNSYFYGGVKDSYMNVLSKKGETYDNTETDNIIDLDQAFISMSAMEGAIKISAGRKYYSIGTGLVLNGRGDGAELNYTTSVISVNLLSLYTGYLIKDNNPYKLTDKDYSDGAERLFSGGVLSAASGNQQIYLFGLIQIDRPKKDDPEKEKYNSQYYGAGLNGVFFKDISYYAETVFESGESYITRTAGNEKSKIAAYAFNSGLNYFIPVVLNPTLILQYAFGSGDSYRKDYSSGNRNELYGANGYDKGFISFGTFSGGYALRPVLSNIHIIRAGVTCLPFSLYNSAYLKKMSLGAKYSYYLKDEKASSINAGEADDYDKSFIGQGIDISLRWQVFYDASFYVNYGLFLPGDAYKNKDANNFIMAGINLSI